MATTITSRRGLPRHIESTETEFSVRCSSSVSTSSSCSCSRPNLVLLSNRNSEWLKYVVRHRQVYRPRSHANGDFCNVRAVLAEGVARTSVAPLSPTAKPEMGVNDTSLQSTLEHRLWLGFGASAAVGMVAKAVLAAHSLTDVAGIGFAAVAAYILSDLGTGVYHWGVDNYGDAKTPIFGSQIDAFQGHHRRPWTITKREFSNNLHDIARPVGFVLIPFLLLPSNPTGDAFLGLFLGLVVISQQFHSWAHSKKSQLPAVVNFLQDRGVLIPRKMHGAHHRAPYSINYCIVSGLWNPLLDKTKFFPRLESAIYSRWGVAPRCWADAVAAEWKQDGAYFEDGTDIKVDREI